jgi:surface antigen
MKTIKKIMAASLITVSLTACAQESGYGYGGGYGSRPVINKQTIGTLAGGAAGAVAATNIGKGKGNIAAVAIGTLLGAAVGSEIGKSLDRADQAAMYRTSQNAFENVPTGQSTTWRNPDSGNYGTCTPTRTYNDDGMNCREFTQTIVVGGRMQEGYGTACRMPDGSWQIRS